MKNKILLLIGIAPAILFSCKPTPCTDVLFKKDTTIESERKNNLFAFVGEKIDVNLLPYAENTSSGHIRGKYKVLQRVYGCYSGDTIEFYADYQYDWPQFSKYKTVLLFLSKKDDEYYGDSYVYNDVYMTRSGKWAGPWFSDDESGYDSAGIFPQPMDFIEKVAYPLSDTMNIGNLANPRFPHPLFWTVGDSAIAQYGYYIDDIFKAKKEGLLRLKGWFGAEENKSTKHGQVQDVLLPTLDVQLEEAPPPTFEQTGKKFNLFWNNLEDVADQSGRFPYQNLLPDSFWVCGSLFTRQKFMQECNSKIFDSSFHAQWKRYVNVDIECEPANLPDLLPSARKRILKEKDGYVSIRVRILQIYAYKFYQELYLSFIETQQGFKIYDIRFANNRSCCF